MEEKVLSQELLLVPLFQRRSVKEESGVFLCEKLVELLAEKELFCFKRVVSEKHCGAELMCSE